MAQDEIVVALAGNPNAGKTSLFNALTGAHQHVGNYPGVTVEKKEGFFTYKGKTFRVIDLPGIYSLTAFSQEEIVARRFLVEQRPQVVVDVVDSTNLDRNLYLAVQMMELGFTPLIALNFSDEARFIGQTLDVSVLNDRLHTTCVETVGHRGGGREKLMEAIFQAVEERMPSPPVLSYQPTIEEEIHQLTTLIDEKVASPYPIRYVAIKLLEHDRDIAEVVYQRLEQPEALREAVDRAVKNISRRLGEDPEVIIADTRHGFAGGVVREATISPPRYDRVSLSDQVDSILTHRILGLPFFFFFMYALFWATFTLGEKPMEWLELLFTFISNHVSMLWGDAGQTSLLRSLIVDGVLNGVGNVIVFLPNIMLLFLGIAALEDTGYMARAAFIMDKVMHKLGLHGKSFIPMLIGFGCTVPAIMATRTLENRRDRLTTMLVLPLISCGARLPIYLLIIPAFFPPEWNAPMLWTIYLIGIVLAALFAKIFRVTIFKGRNAPFVMELPPYRLPTLKSVVIHMWNRAWLYLKKAGTIILGISILMWFLSTFPRMPQQQIVQAQKTMKTWEVQRMKLEYSIAGRIGKSIEPVFKLMGFDWKIATAFIGAFAAKEVFVAQMGIVYSIAEGEEDTTLRQKLHQRYSPLVGFCIMLFALITTPCMATFSVMKQETGSWKWPLFQTTFLTLLAFIITVIVYQTGSLILA